MSPTVTSLPYAVLVPKPQNPDAPVRPIDFRIDPLPGAGFDAIWAGGGDDAIDGGRGDDQIDGGGGSDVAFYQMLQGVERLNLPVEADLEAGAVYVGYRFEAREADTLVSIESIVTGWGMDWVAGSAADNDIFTGAAADSAFGRGGDDRLFGGEDGDGLHGGEGNDEVFGEEGDDRLYGDGGIDRLLGGDGADYLSGGNDPDELNGGAGADTMAGGDGEDTYHVDHVDDVIIEWGGYPHALEINAILASVSYTLGNEAGGFIYFGLTGTGDIHGYGNQYRNTITGQAGNNTLAGGGGDDGLYGEGGRDLLIGGSGGDYLSGGADDDRLIGGEGADELFGGSGSDTFVFQAGSDSPANAPDTIGSYGFAFDSPGAAHGDVIDLGGIDADVGQAGDQSFILSHRPIAQRLVIGSNANGDTVINGFIDSTFGADIVVVIRDGAVPHTAYSSADFVL
jgi:Ca2+-binding RTX toxin-like protein